MSASRDAWTPRARGFADEAVAAWRDVADAFHLPAPDPETGLVEAFRGYVALEDVPPSVLEGRLIDPAEYWGWPIGVAVHTRVAKQADVLQLLCQTPDEAHRYFRTSAFLDLEGDFKAVSGGTFIGGVHTAACAGTWQAAVLGFGGLRLDAEALHLEPVLPPGWTRLAFGAVRRGERVAVEVTADAVTVRADDANGASVPVRVATERCELAPGGVRRVVRTPAGRGR